MSMRVRRLLPYIAGLLVLSFALGSIPHGTAGGGLLFGSYWLLYLSYLAPVVTLGVIVALIVFVGLNWRELGTGIGFGMARRRMTPKRRNRLGILIYGVFWVAALGILTLKKGTIFNPNTNSTIVKEIVGVSSPPSSPLPIGLAGAITNLLDTSWFSLGLLGLLVVGGLVLLQAARVSLKETSQLYSAEMLRKQEAGLDAVESAIKLVSNEQDDPRTRIITCYQHLVLTAQRLGTPVTPDLTARELENAVRTTFHIKGPAISDLTKLFEEARYSMHEISDEDAATARTDLVSISRELSVQPDAET